MMACLVLAIIPIIVFYLVCQKYIVSGVMAGASRADDSRRQSMAGSQWASSRLQAEPRQRRS